MSRRAIIPYREDLKLKARDLRNNSTYPEILLWLELKGTQMCGYDFHRQKPLLDFIVDFYCYELKLVIEIDEEYHTSQKEYDEFKRACLSKYDITIMHFSKEDVLSHREQVIEYIESYVEWFEDGRIDRWTHPFFTYT